MASLKCACCRAVGDSHALAEPTQNERNLGPSGNVNETCASSGNMLNKQKAYLSSLAPLLLPNVKKTSIRSHYYYFYHGGGIAVGETEISVKNKTS